MLHCHNTRTDPGNAAATYRNIAAPTLQKICLG
jgi:hypothetical protein